jgi:hypothetical protein
MIQSVVSEAVPSNKVIDLLLSKTSEIIGINPEVVEAIVKFQFKDARKATTTLSAIRFCHFGTFVINQAKTGRFINKIKGEILKSEELLKDPSIIGRKAEAIQEKLEIMRDKVRYLSAKNLEVLPPTKHKENNKLKKLGLLPQKVEFELIDDII